MFKKSDSSNRQKINKFYSKMSLDFFLSKGKLFLYNPQEDLGFL